MKEMMKRINCYREIEWCDGILIEPIEYQIVIVNDKPHVKIPCHEYYSVFIDNKEYRAIIRPMTCIYSKNVCMDIDDMGVDYWYLPLDEFLPYVKEQYKKYGGLFI